MRSGLPRHEIVKDTAVNRNCKSLINVDAPIVTET